MIRFLKQLVYGIFYLAAFAALVGLVYLVFFRPDPIPPPEDSLIPEIPAATFGFEDEALRIEGTNIRVTGVLANESPRITPAVRITATIFDKNGFELNSSETFQENIGAYEKREFTVFFPQDPDLLRQVGADFSPELSYTIVGE